MARPVRVEFENAVYHVAAHGNERKDIFRDDDDRKRFLETLAETVERFGVVNGYSDSSGVYRVVKRLESRAKADRELGRQLHSLRGRLSDVPELTPFR